jgi:hypothetical protein
VRPWSGGHAHPLDRIAAALAVQLSHRLAPDPDAIGRSVGELEAVLNVEERI